MKRETLIQGWHEKTKPAVFSARKGPNILHSPSVNVYPFRNGRGFLWVIWHGKHGIKDMSRNIKTGGVTARDYERACKLAVHKLLNYRGRPNE
jgi:hypothetical protein